MSTVPAIVISHLDKSFKLPHERHSSLKGTLINFRSRGYEKQQVLNNISFEVNEGEFFGVVGRNGSGKSTLLKLLAGIYTPDAGSIRVNGRLTPFIELGVGFNPELTGRENVFLNGALLGFNRKAMLDMYDDIVEFAELDRFMDQKLKNYSSGMQVRLAFSIAIRANTDVLILDEVLAVGDVNFQKKCFDYFAKLKREKKTIVLVTHDMSAVERFCDRAVLIDGGKVVAIGQPSEITQKYSDLNFDSMSTRLATKKPKAKSEGDGGLDVDVYVSGSSSGKSGVHSQKDERVMFDIRISAKNDIGAARVGIIVKNSGGTPIFATNTGVDDLALSLRSNKTTSITYEIDNVFANGVYEVALTVRNQDSTITYYTNDSVASFVAGGRKHEYAVVSPHYTVVAKNDD